ncbi:hypothetical protein NLG97_g10502 [Lecanicillium saksenae]|uniref:Uncharacterized protein n=1 Tax=Lecanicillium saksenae TaxID=468837 RepID=A0ACC1QD04_9HYPO|nr:hypothetical protein NLG97_g10502 [Lecanicillium saksenae]
MLLLHLADIQEELLRCTWETRDETAQQYYERKIKRQLRQVQDGKLPGVAEQDVRDQLALLPQILGDQKDCRDFALEHGDLRSENIIVSEQCRIIGVIDWGFAEMVPVVQAARLPRFLFPSESAAAAPSDDMIRDRRVYEISYSSQDSPAARAMKRAQTGADVGFRTLYLESVKSTDMLKSMASIGWKLPHSDEDRD